MNRGGYVRNVSLSKWSISLTAIVTTDITLRAARFEEAVLYIVHLNVVGVGYHRNGDGMPQEG